MKLKGVRKIRGAGFSEIVDLLRTNDIKFSDYFRVDYNCSRGEGQFGSGLARNYIDGKIITETRAKDLLYQAFGRPREIISHGGGIEENLFEAEYFIDSFQEFTKSVISDAYVGLIPLTNKGNILQQTIVYYNDINADMKSRGIIITPQAITKEDLL
jgi:hypothetical protein